jgi:hypothetical protein
VSLNRVNALLARILLLEGRTMAQREKRRGASGGGEAMIRGMMSILVKHNEDQQLPIRFLRIKLLETYWIPCCCA